MPALAPIAEAGDLPGYDMAGWIGMMAPAGLPRDMAARLSAEVQKIMQAPDVRERFVALGLEPTPPGSTPEEFAEFARKQYERYGNAVRQGEGQRIEIAWMMPHARDARARHAAGAAARALR